MTTTFSLTPLLRSTVGFDRFNELFESLRETDTSFNSYPPYNIEKLGDDRYGIAMAVAGFTEDDLTITVEHDRVIVAGRIAAKAEEGAEFLYRGIAMRPFQHNFRLADHMKVTGAHLANGLLRIDIMREIPEERKPRTIAINTTPQTQAIAHAAAEGKGSKKAA